MTDGWAGPGRVEAHWLLRVETSLGVVPIAAAQRAILPTRTVEDVFHRGVIADVLDSPSDAVNARLDSVIGGLPIIGTVGIGLWHQLARVANTRRPVRESLIGLTLQAARELLSSPSGNYLVRPLRHEDRVGRNDTYEALYFRDSGLHRRLIETQFGIGAEQAREAAQVGRTLADLHAERERRTAALIPSRWEGFVITSVLELVGDCCDAFTYRDLERDEIDLILNWCDRSPPERWAIEVKSKKLRGHPASHFPGTCRHLGVAESHRFIVFRANACNGQERGRYGVPALSLPRMLDRLRQRLR